MPLIDILSNLLNKPKAKPEARSLTVQRNSKVTAKYKVRQVLENA